MGIIDVGTQGVQGHAALAVPFGPGDLGTAKAARDVDPDAQGTHAHGVLNRALHGTTERNPTLKLLRDAFTHQRGIQLGLADLDDVEVQFAVGHRGELLAQTFRYRRLSCR